MYVMVQMKNQYNDYTCYTETLLSPT